MSRTTGDLARYLEATLLGDPSLPISGVSSPEQASAEDVIYLESRRHQGRAENSAARCVLARAGVQIEGKTILESANPKLAFAKASEWLLMPRAATRGIHPTAVIAKSARLGQQVSVGPYVVVEDEVIVGDGTRLDAFCFAGHGSQLGENCRLHPRVTLYPGTRLGNRVEIHSGSVIGGDGFGYVFGEGRQWKFPQIGAVEIQDDVEVGCNATIDRGSLGTTRIGKGVKIDNLVQVGHNVQIGEHSVIAAQVGISGSTVLGRFVAVGGQAGFGEHAIVEDRANIGGQAGVLGGKTVRQDQTVWGTPCRPLDRFKEQYAWSARLPEILPDLAERIRRLEELSKKRQ